MNKLAIHHIETDKRMWLSLQSAQIFLKSEKILQTVRAMATKLRHQRKNSWDCLHSSPLLRVSGQCPTQTFVIVDIAFINLQNSQCICCCTLIVKVPLFILISMIWFFDALLKLGADLSSFASSINISFLTSLSRLRPSDMRTVAEWTRLFWHRFTSTTTAHG